MTDKRVAIVTGSSSGIGAAVARRLAKNGMRVVVNSVRSVDAGRELAGSLPGAIYVQADVAVEEQARELVSAAVAEFGQLDVLVNNAGVTRRILHADLAAVTPAVWQEILDLNVIGTWQTAAAAVPHLRDSGAGCIVNVSSVAGNRPVGSSIPYAVSKAAIEHMTRLLANAVGPEVRVNAVAPGLIETPWTKDFTEIAEMTKRVIPLKRVGLPEDVAEVVAGLTDFKYVTGHVLQVDGGAHLI